MCLTVGMLVGGKSGVLGEGGHLTSLNWASPKESCLAEVP